MANKRLKKKQWKAAGCTDRCAVCGGLLWSASGDYVQGSRGAVCRTCLRMGYLMTEEPPVSLSAAEPAGKETATPQVILRELERSIQGQEEAKRAVALAVWKQKLRAAGEKSVPTGHVLLYGPTGCGKTFLATQAARAAGLPFCVFDATSLSEAGYKGSDAIDILKDYFTQTAGDPNRKWGVVILDEIDKLAGVGSSARQAYFRGTQHTLLKMLEGCSYEDVNSADLLFVLCGAFPEIGREERMECMPIGFDRRREPRQEHAVLPEDFVRFGMERELMGRIPGLAAVHPLTTDDLVRILIERENSAFCVYREFFRTRGTELILDDENAQAIAARALALGTGARGLKAELDRIMEPLMFQLAEGNRKERVSIVAVRELSESVETAAEGD